MSFRTPTQAEPALQRTDNAEGGTINFLLRTAP